VLQKQKLTEQLGRCADDLINFVVVQSDRARNLVQVQHYLLGNLSVRHQIHFNYACFCEVAERRLAQVLQRLVVYFLKL